MRALQTAQFPHLLSKCDLLQRVLPAWFKLFHHLSEGIKVRLKSALEHLSRHNAPVFSHFKQSPAIQATIFVKFE